MLVLSSVSRTGILSWSWYCALIARALALHTSNLRCYSLGCPCSTPSTMIIDDDLAHDNEKVSIDTPIETPRDAATGRTTPSVETSSGCYSESTLVLSALPSYEDREPLLGHRKPTRKRAREPLVRVLLYTFGLGSFVLGWMLVISQSSTIHVSRSQLSA
jgi:hypothetical protein